ncbi:MAG TPA: methylenetetrahydrofolate reductase [Solirubrobacteraceae bacterium]|jgi:methylenetetrahydrofolate reductase (NADPH)|nr:methylenetetrahydrofolate reductase [Solirubrobacteraceae bacterium]
MSSDDRVQYEVLPFARSEEQAAQLAHPVRLTITCSPKHGPERSVEFARRLCALGHCLTVHIAARMVRDREHLDSLLDGMADAGVDDLFLIGGDADPVGEFSSAVQLLGLIAVHPRRPQTIGIAGYPEGHPKIEPETLDEALREKSTAADYVTTQMCFDPAPLRRWTVRQRESGITLPVLVGMPGKVARKRLLEMSARVGVGPSVTFLRKQRGVRALFSKSTADRLFDEFAPALADPQLNIVGFHYFTFNDLVETWKWHHEKIAATGTRAHWEGLEPARSYVHPQQKTTT